MLPPFQLENRTVLVTGASSGIGRATAMALDAAGARLLLTGRRAEALAETLAVLGSRDHVTSTFDLRATDEIAPWLSGLCRSANTKLHGIVHCAGTGLRASIRALSRQHMDEVFAIHVYAALALIKAGSARAMVSEQGSSIVLLSSAAALSANPGLVAYSAAKAALHSIARTASLELIDRRVRVNCLAPAYVNTSMLAEAREKLPGGFEAIALRQHLGWIEPAEVAGAAAYLLSDASRSVTGTVWPIDGGYLL